MREAIFSGFFAPGERLVERKLCDLLDVSRSVVREVLRQLESEGLVETISHQGPVVATLDANRARQIYDLRALLEGQAARICAEKATPETLAELSMRNQSIQDAFERGEFVLVMERTTAFYELMFLGCGLEMAWEMVQSLNARINRLRAMTISSAERKKATAREMQALVEALLRRDADAAEKAAREHINRAAEIAIAKLSK
ncbi:GntR family transcriptional regulator [Comamonas sp. Tr-654]|nr:GntR family transcriptional regulator [Comamonas sp. Tr-654]NIF82326.1 GntR family transcriptional regulator [Comamonas sp. Tr-654]